MITVHYEIETKMDMECGHQGWTSCFTDEVGEIINFESFDDAKSDLMDFIESQHEAFEMGNMADKYDIEDYRIVKITTEVIQTN